MALERSGSYYYFHADGLASITHITNVAKTVVQSYTYDAYGIATASSDFRNSFQHTAREYDWETGTLHMRERTRDLMDGNFASKDPLSYQAGDINLYRYAGGNVTNFTDPFGLDYHHIVPQAVWRNLNLTGEVKTFLNKAVVDAGNHNFRTPHREYNQIIREMWGDFFKGVNPESITKGQVELFVDSVKFNPKSGKLLDEILVKGGGKCLGNFLKGIKGGAKILPVIGALIYTLDELFNVDRLY